MCGEETDRQRQRQRQKQRQRQRQKKRQKQRQKKKQKILFYFQYFLQKGDSGGPLVVVNSKGRVEVVGIVSFGFKCDGIGLPAVFTKVHFYLEWIEENIQVRLG